MGWPREVLPVLQQPLCSLPVLAVATVLDVGALWLYDLRLQRIIPVAEGQTTHGCSGGVQAACADPGGRRTGSITEVLLSLPEGDDNVATNARHTLDALDLEPVRLV